MDFARFLYPYLNLHIITDSPQSIACSVGIFYCWGIIFYVPVSYLWEVILMTKEQKEKIIRFRRQGLGYADIGRELDISKDTVKSFCRRNGLMVSESKPVDDKDRCRECGKPIVQQEKMKRRVFCCKACREKWWTEHADRIDRKAVYTFTCAGCGRTFTAYGNKNRKYCSHGCYVADRFGGGAADEREAISG